MYSVPASSILFWVFSTLVIYAWAAPSPQGVGLPPKMHDHTGVAVNMPHAKRVVCELDVPGEYPEKETKMVGLRRQESPCHE